MTQQFSLFPLKPDIQNTVRSGFFLYNADCREVPLIACFIFTGHEKSVIDVQHDHIAADADLLHDPLSLIVVISCFKPDHRCLEVSDIHIFDGHSNALHRLFLFCLLFQWLWLFYQLSFFLRLLFSFSFFVFF